MISKNDVFDLYRLVLDREPESEQVVNEKRKNRNLQAVLLEMLASEEFIRNNEQVIRGILHDE